MEELSTPAQPVITSIDDVIAPNITSTDVIHGVEVENTALSIALTLPTTTPVTLTSTSTGGNTTSSTVTDTTTTASSTTTTNKDTGTVECPDLFSASYTDTDDNIKNSNHHHTIIINNNNKAVIFKHHHTDNDDDHNHEKDDERQNATSGKQAKPRERTPGAIVTAICSHGTVPLTVTFLECQSDGTWNATLPECQGPLDVSSKTLYFSVIGGVCGMAVLCLALLYFLMMKNRRREKGPLSPPLDPDRAVYVDPYAVGERLYSIPSPFHYQRGDITYAKPQIYSTYLNPSFYEDVYQRWRRQEQQVSEKLYDSPFMNTGSPAWPDNQDMALNPAKGDYSKTMDRLCHIPRAKIASLDQASVRSHESTSTLTFTGSRPQRVVYGRQGSVMSHSTMPKYGNCHAPRRQNSQLEPPAGLHLVKAFEDAPLPPSMEFESEQRTPF